MKKNFYISISIIFSLILSICFSYFFLPKNNINDKRIHEIEFITNATKNSDFIFEQYNRNKDGFEFCGKALFQKSLLTGIQYVEGEDEEIEVHYNVTYAEKVNSVTLTADAPSIDYSDNLIFYPDLSNEGKFDGTIYINGEEINVFEINEEDNTYGEDCGLLTSTVIGGIALWKIIAGVTVATACITFAAYPEYYVKGLENFANGLTTIGREVIDGMTYIMTKATNYVTTKIKKNTDSRKYNKYYPAIAINNSNTSKYPNAKIGDTLISKYPVSAKQARKNFKKGIDCYTYYGSDAKNIIKSTYLFGKTYNEIHIGQSMFWHYHSTKGYSNNKHMHSFYGNPVMIQ